MAVYTIESNYMDKYCFYMYTIEYATSNYKEAITEFNKLKNKCKTKDNNVVYFLFERDKYSSNLLDSCDNYELY